MENYNIHLDQNRMKKEPEEHKEVLYHEEDEIDLRDYINVLLKRKRIIGAIFLVAVIAAVVISLLMTPVYEATNLIEIGKIKNETIETFDDIKAVFSRPAILKEVHNKLGLPKNVNVESVVGKFTLEKENETNASKFIKVSGRAETPEKSVEVANVVTQILLDRHQQLFSEAERMFEIEMESINKNKEKTDKDIVQVQKDIVRLEQDVKIYEQRINQKDNAQSDAQGRIAESYINLLATVKNQKENKEYQLLNLEQQLVNLDQQIQEKEYEKAYQTKTTEVEIPATPPETRISPKRKQNVMIAGVLGLFVGILYAFGAEYFSKEKMV
ncbi:MAG: Wzz/FepE/Etk N-terminal domain-containing protein [Patescibacteria group bacterium]|nr:Wzz/FepE/Etk N-terminal domain-containing protein [Patescibacteria group bacterium]